MNEGLIKHIPMKKTHLHNKKKDKEKSIQVFQNSVNIFYTNTNIQSSVKDL